MTLNDIHNQGNDENAHKQNDTPVEGVQGNGNGVGPEGPEEGEANVCETNDVDWDTPLS